MKFLLMILFCGVGHSLPSLADASRIECMHTSYTHHGFYRTLVRTADGPQGEMGYIYEDGGMGPVYFRGSHFGTDTFCLAGNPSHLCPQWIKFRSGFTKGAIGDVQTDVEAGRVQDVLPSHLNCRITEGEKLPLPSSQISDVLPERAVCAARKRFPTPRDYAVFAELRGAVGLRESKLSGTSLLAKVIGGFIEPMFGTEQKNEIDRMASLGFKPVYARDKLYRDNVYLDFYYNNSGFISQAGASGVGSSETPYDSLNKDLPYYFSNSDGALVFKKPVGNINKRCML